MPNLPHTVSGVITEFTDDEATITLDNESKFMVPKSIIPVAATAGSSVHIAVFSENDVASEHERLAKAVLSEMLRGE